MAYKTPAALYKMVPVEEALEVRDRPEKKQKKSQRADFLFAFSFLPGTCPTHLPHCFL